MTTRGSFPRSLLALVLAAAVLGACKDKSGSGSGGSASTNNVRLSSMDNGGGGYTITVTGEGLESLGVRGISFDLRLLGTGSESLVASAVGSFFAGGSVGAGFGAGSATLLRVGAGIPPATSASTSSAAQPMLTLQLASTAFPSGTTGTLRWRVENLKLFDADPTGGFAMQIPAHLFRADALVTVTVTG